MPGTTHLHLYALSLGSNRPLSRKRTSVRLLGEATESIARLGRVHAIAPLIATPPLGPSRRHFVNGALLLETALQPDALLCELQSIEQALGRRRFRRWGARSMDIDIILWSGGRVSSRWLSIPHAAFRIRNFVLHPLTAIAPKWRDPHSGLSVRHLHARLNKAAPKQAARG